MNRLFTRLFILCFVIIYTLPFAAMAYNKYTPAPDGAVKETPSEYKFKIEGESTEYVLLDTDSLNSSSRFFVINALCLSGGTVPWTSLGGSAINQKFDPNILNNVAQLLNPQILDPDTQDTIRTRWPDFSDTMLKYIDNSHVWDVEAGYRMGSGSEYTVKCGIAFLSYSEYADYADRVGYGNDGKQWWLRTPGDDSAYQVLSVDGLTGQTGQVSGVSIASGTIGRWVRPCYWLNDDFFKEVRIDLDSAGSSVLQAIRSQYTADDLKNIYPDANDLLKIGFLIQEIGMDAVSVDFRNSDESGIVDITDAGVDLNIYNSSPDMKKNYDVLWELRKLDQWSNNGEPLYTQYSSGEKDAVSAEPNSSVCVNIDFPAPAKGLVKIILTVMQNGNVISSEEKNLCYIKPYERQFLDNYSTIGVNTDSEMSLPERETLEKAGIRTRRIEMSWDTVEKIKGVFDFSRFKDTMLWMEKRGIDTYLLLDYSNELYCPTPSVTDNTLISRPKNFYGPRSKEQVDAFCNYALQALKAYPQITMIEIYNEPNFSYWQPNGGSSKYAMPDYANLVKAVSLAVKSVRPDVQVVAGAFGNGGSYTAMNCQKEFMNEGVAPFIDGVSTHPYYGNDKSVRVDTGHIEGNNGYLGGLTWISGTFFDNVVNHNDAFLDRYESEVGIDTSYPNGVSYDVQAEEIAKMFIYGQAYERRQTLYFNYSNRGTDTAYSEHNLGILLNDGRPKPAYAALSQTANVLNGAFYQGQLELGDDRVRAYLYSKNGEPLIVAWTTIEETGQEEYRKSITISNRLVEDIYGNSIDGMSSNVTLGSSPKYIYGVSEDFYRNMAICESNKHYNRLLYINDDVLGYDHTWLPQTVRTAVENLQMQVNAIGAMPDGDKILDMINSIYHTGELVLSTELSSEQKLELLGDLHSAGKAWGKLYAHIAGAADIGENEINTAREKYDAKLSFAKAQGEDNANMQISGSLLRQADRHIQMGNYVDAPDYYPDNPDKQTVASYHKLMAEKLAGWVNKSVSTEEADLYASLLIYTDFRYLPYEIKINLRKGFPETVNITVDNTRRHSDLTDVIPVVTDDEGRELARGEAFNVPAGDISQPISLTFSAPSDMTIDKHIFKLQLQKDGKVIALRGLPVNVEEGINSTEMKVLDASVADTPQENIFEIDGKKFILLNQTDEGYFVLAKERYGSHIFTPSGGSQKYDPQLEGSLAQYLNSNTFKALLPTAIQEGIITHEWRTEMGKAGWGADDPYTVIADIAALSYMEWRDYHKRIGYSDGSDVDFWLRTAPQNGRSGNTENILMSALTVSAADGMVDYRGFSKEQGVRPAFYLSSDFFAKNKINTDTAGANVIDAIRSCKPEELAEAGYTASELRELGFDEINTDYAVKDGQIYAQAVILGDELPDPSSIQLIIKGSDDKGRIKNIYMTSPEMIGESGIYKAVLEIPKTPECEFSAMLWDSLASMRSLEERYVF